MDISEALAPTSDQLDAIELVTPRTFTIDAGTTKGKREGKTVLEIRLVGFDRVWRPSKGMLDVLAACWGLDSREWVGRQVTVYNDTEVMFGRDKVGGIRISHLSHIDGPRNVQIRGAGQGGRKQTWHVEPIVTLDVATSTDIDALRAAYKTATPDVQAQILARVDELKGGAS